MKKKIALLALLCLCSSANAEETIFKDITGRWSWVGNEQACTVQYTDVSFYNDNTRALFDYSEGTLNDEGEPAKNSHYSVVSYQGNSITLTLDGEQRTTESGDLIQWTLILMDQNTWVWRMAHWPPEVSNDVNGIWSYRRLRCTTSEAE